MFRGNMILLKDSEKISKRTHPDSNEVRENENVLILF